MKKNKAFVGAAWLLLGAAIFIAAMSTQNDTNTAPATIAEKAPFAFIQPLRGEAPGSENIISRPASLPQAQEAALTPTALSAAQTKAQTMRAEGASTDDIYRMLATTLSPKIAGLLMETGNAETAWKSRVDSYMSERNNLRNNEALQQLRDTRFTAEEQHLLATYETSASPQLTQ